jgi:hypothetical protein
LHCIALGIYFATKQKPPWLPKPGFQSWTLQDFQECARSFTAHKWRDFTRKKIIIKKMKVAFLSKVDKSIPFLSSHSFTATNVSYVVLFT